MTIKVTPQYKTKETKFPLIMVHEHRIWLVTHDQEDGLARVLLQQGPSLGGDEQKNIGKREVIDDMEYMRMKPYEHALILENNFG